MVALIEEASWLSLMFVGSFFLLSACGSVRE